MVGYQADAIEGELRALAFWLDHADGERACMSGTTRGGHCYDLAAGGAVLVALFIEIGFGEGDSALGVWSIVLGVRVGIATAVIFVLRMELERRAGRGATHRPDLFSFELEDVMYLVGPITWLGLVQPFLVLAGIGAALFALFVLLQGRGFMVEGKT